MSEKCCVLSDKIRFLYLQLRRPRPTHGCRAGDDDDDDDDEDDDDDDNDDDICHYNPALWFKRHLSCYVHERNIFV